MDCFGFYSGPVIPCTSCKAAPRCKALVNSDFLDGFAAVLDVLTADLPDVLYRNTEFNVSRLSQVMDPPAATLTAEDIDV